MVVKLDVQSTEFQFTPLREGRRGWNYPSLCFCPISIHAPPRGATGCGNEERVLPRDFNSRPSARGDFRIEFSRNPLPNFNSRPSARGDLGEAQTVIEAQAISIHAPPRGATMLSGYFYSHYKFQFTPLREGRRLAGSPCDVSRHHFNSRPSARGDGRDVEIYGHCRYFNSRPSARGDCEKHL